MHGHFGLDYFGDVQGVNLVSHKIIEPSINFAIDDVIDAFTGGSGVKEGPDCLVCTTGGGCPGGCDEPLREGRAHMVRFDMTATAEGKQ